MLKENQRSSGKNESLNINFKALPNIYLKNLDPTGSCLSSKDFIQLFDGLYYIHSSTEM